LQTGDTVVDRAGIAGLHKIHTGPLQRFHQRLGNGGRGSSVRTSHQIALQIDNGGIGGRENGGNIQEISGLVKLAALFAGSSLAGQERAITHQLYNPGKIELLKYDPEWDFPEISCPVLALNGDKDCQVPVENLAYIQQGITANGNTQVTTITYPGLNHMFQTARTGLPVEYSDIEETIHPKVLEDIATWLQQIIKK
jgi:pimeloyl-ACP methyl ester carboxylesterase